MSEIFINKAKALAVTGHRILTENFDIQELYDTLEKFINKEFDTFLIGMAIGFDAVCFNTLEKLKEKYSLNEWMEKSAEYRNYQKKKT